MKILFLIFLSFVSFFLSSCENEYTKFHEKKINIEEKEVDLEKFLSNFDLEKIRYIENTKLFHTPDLKLLSDIVELIDDSKEKVYLETYILTEKKIQSALKKAKDRWVDVRVILEKNVYKAPSLNKKSFNNLYSSWVSVTWSNPENFSLNHTKMLIVDNKAIISTWNYSYSSFKYNREFFLFLEDKDIISKLEDIFLADFYWEKTSVYDDNLILSPDYTREKFDKLIASSKKSIKMYVNNISDKDFLNILVKKSSEWVNIQMIFPDLKKVSSNEDEIKFLKDNWISVHIVKKPKIHAKSILVDDKYLYIWSINFSYYSIEKNREIWLIFKDDNIINKFIDIFNNDYKK